MTCFKTPDNVIQKIEGEICRFLWGQKGEEKKVHWLRRERLCKPKNEGGLGIRDIAAFNMALLAKQGWLLVQDDNSLLAQVLKARYFPRGSFLSAHLGYPPSYTWRSILEGRNVLNEELVWVVGDGRAIIVMRDPWLLDGTAPCPVVAVDIL